MSRWWYGTIAVGVIILGVLAWIDLAPSGRFVATSDFSNYHPSISPLFPTGRVGAVEHTANGSSRLLLQEPVYVTVRLPRTMQTAVVKLEYQSDDFIPLRLGLQQQPAAPGDDWHYTLMPLMASAQSNGWKVATVSFPLDDAAVTDQTIRLILSAPGYSSSLHPLNLHQINVELSGQPLTLGVVLRGLYHLVEHHAL